MNDPDAESEWTSRLGTPWDQTLATRTKNITALREARQTTEADASRVTGLLKTWREGVVPMTARWRETMAAAAQLPAYAQTLETEWRQAVRSRPGRHWSGILVRLRLRLFHLFVMGLSLGKILVVVLFVVAMIYIILEWTGGGVFR